jgi:hypothetical protein
VKTITVRRFDGGLNTAAAPELLSPSYTPDGVNFAIEDSGSIARRDGYVRVTPEALRSTPMKALWRYIKENGNKYWVAVAGTALLYKIDDALDASGSANLTTTVAQPWAEGGSASLITNATIHSVDIPYCTHISVELRADITLDYSVDSGAWVTTTTAGEWTTTTGRMLKLNVSATSHNLRFRTSGTRNSTCLRLGATTGKSCSAVRGGAFTPTTDYPMMVSVRFRDVAGSDVSRYVSLRNEDTGVYLDLGALSPRSASHYVSYRSGDGYSYTTGVTRTTGWHEAVFVMTPLGNGDYSARPYSLDGTVLTGHPSDTGTSWRLYLQCFNYTTATVTAEFDAVRYDQRLLDDFTDYSNWTQGGTVGGSNLYIVSSTDTEVRGYVGRINYSSSGSWTRLTTVSATARNFTAAQLDGNFWVSNEYDRVAKFDGTTYTTNATAPPAGFLLAKGGRLYAAGKSTDKSLLEYTTAAIPMVPSAWTDGASIRPTGKDAGGECTGMAVWNDIVFYFGHSRVNLINVTADGTGDYNKEATHRYGCVAPKSLVAIPNGLIFLSADGVRTYGSIPGVFSSDGAGFSLLSKDITPTIDRISDTSLACGMFYKNRYYLSVALDDATVNTHTLVYRFADDDVPGSWTLYDYGVSCFAQFVRGDEDAMYGGDTSEALLYQLETGGTDDGTPIIMRYKVPPIIDKSFATSTHFRRMHLLASADEDQELAIDFYNDDVPGQSTVVTVTEGTDAQPLRVPVSARGRSLGMVFTTSGSEQDIQISEVTLVHTGSRLR